MAPQLRDLWSVELCSSIERYQSFAEMFFFHLQGAKNISLQKLVPAVSSKLHWITLQKVVTLTVIGLTDANLVLSLYLGLLVPVNTALLFHLVISCAGAAVRSSLPLPFGRDLNNSVCPRVWAALCPPLWDICQCDDVTATWHSKGDSCCRYAGHALKHTG